jgi:type II secretory pathway pseudopilin PulG
MMTQPTPIRRPRPSKTEEGYILVAAIFMLAIFTIALAVALPKVIKEIQRDREIETMHRGKQYIRGVRMYYKKFGSTYPTSVDALIKPTNNIRFMRKKYADPTTGKEDWKPVRYGQNKAPTVMGFFGQAIGGVGGCAPSPLGANTSQGALSSSGIGGTSNSSTSSTNCGPTGQNTSSTTSTSATTTPPADPNAANTNTTTSSTPGSTTGLNGQTFGGGPIMGFSPNSPKQSIMVYKTKNHYNEWEFVYDPIAEQQMMQMGGSGGPTSLTTTPTTPPPPPPAPAPPQ